MQPRVWFFLLTLSLAASFPHVSSADGKSGCPVTKAPDPPFVPPAPYHADNATGEFLYGTPALWAVVATNWHVHGGSKLPYFRQDFDATKERDPRLSVVARRLDGPDAMVWAGWANSGSGAENIGKGFMVTGLEIPTEGCWEIAAHYSPAPTRIQTLTYTVWVEP